MALRDRVLPVIDRARAVMATLGLRRYSVAVRRKMWPTAIGSPGETPTITDYMITPAPKVRIDPIAGEQETGIHGSTGTFQDRIFTIDKITPHYVKPDGIATGGYTTADLDMTPTSKREEVCIVLTGDDGVARECDLVSREWDHAFTYKMKVRVKRRAT